MNVLYKGDILNMECFRYSAVAFSCGKKVLLICKKVCPKQRLMEVRKQIILIFFICDYESIYIKCVSYLLAENSTFFYTVASIYPTFCRISYERQVFISKEGWNFLAPCVEIPLCD